MTKRKKTIIGCALIIGIPAAIAIIAYIMISVYYMNRFFPGTYINGIDFSNKTAKEAEKELEAYHSNYTFRIIERDGSQEVLKGSEIGHKIVFNGIEDIKKNQGAWNWPVNLSDRKFYTAESGHGYDEQKLRAAIEALDCMTKDIVEPQNAYVDFTDGVKIIPEIEGNKLDVGKVFEAVGSAIKAGEVRLNIDAAGCYVSPEVTMDTEAFQKEIEPIKKLTKAVITLEIGKKTEVIDASVSEGFLVQDEEGTISLDKEKVRAYVDGLEEKYETWGKPHEFKTTGGELISLSGTLGWSIDVKGETEKIIEELKEGKDVKREVLYDATAPTWEDNEIGDTYIEISRSAQRMWFYKNGSIIVETDVITGCLNEGHATPAGAYKLLNKLRNQTLIGANPDDPYESKVSFWLPFIGNMYGIHDASWRGSFGGSIYVYNGSHGCVNTPYNKVQAIYENIEIGTPVLIY